MTVKYYSDQSVVDTVPNRKGTTQDKKATKSPMRDAKSAGERKEHIAVVNGKLAVVNKSSK